MKFVTPEPSAKSISVAMLRARITFSAHFESVGSNLITAPPFAFSLRRTVSETAPVVQSTSTSFGPSNAKTGHTYAETLSV